MRMEGGKIKLRVLPKWLKITFIKSSLLPCQMDIDKATRGFSVHVDEEINRRLIEPFSEEEIKEALFSMCPTKVPNPDGFQSNFYQNILKCSRLLCFSSLPQHSQ
ncbi:LOW QUALITY PROTEIN: hypothetical protein TorRG33x02_119260 [Trema orientale]|uniref:Uncharacterized protein n=1 Tax=Trema orientale TaxID=63057 RepID=A0A2P5F3C4_TREOI|nr:LOW QUALITY PROTEIN: hypothetical protein TorRG33x02_119260 [Trema orientale]